MDIEQARQILSHITAGHLPADARQAKDLGSLQFAHLVEKVGHIRENALEYSSQETQSYLDSLRKSPLLTFVQKLKISLSTFFLRGDARYQAIAEKVVEYAKKNYFQNLRGLDPTEIETLFEIVIEKKDVRGITRLLESGEFDSEEILDTFNTLREKDQIAAFLKAAANAGKLEIFEELEQTTTVPLFERRQSLQRGVFKTHFPEILAAAIENKHPQLVAKFVLNYGDGIDLSHFLESLAVVARGGYKGALADVRRLLNFAQTQFRETLRTSLFREDFLAKDYKKLPLQVLQELVKGQWAEQGRAAAFQEVLKFIEGTRVSSGFDLLLRGAVQVGDAEVIRALFNYGVEITIIPDKTLAITSEQYGHILQDAYALGGKRALALLSALTETPIKKFPKATNREIVRILEDPSFSNKRLNQFLNSVIRIS